MSAVLETRSLSKWFGEVVALNGVDITIGPGITGILGPNGAGKSTLMNLATGQLSPSKGTLRMFGEPVRNNLGVLRRLGYLPEQDRFWDEVTGYEFVARLAGLSGMSAREAHTRSKRVIERVGLKGRCGDPIGSYSRGMRQRIKLAQALVHDPDLLLLDEPLTGLDPVGRQETIDLLRELADQGRTIIVASHVLHEVESLTQEVILLVRGRILASGSVKHISSHIEQFPHTILCRSPEAREIGRRVVATPGLIGIEFTDDGQGVTIKTQHPGAVYAAITEAVVAGNVMVDRLSAADDNLDAIFKYLVR
jgi:ABC-2 type transport system ATP-binding protein